MWVFFGDEIIFASKAGEARHDIGCGHHDW
jgi:hypothetical protein